MFAISFSEALDLAFARKQLTARRLTAGRRHHQFDGSMFGERPVTWAEAEGLLHSYQHSHS